MSIQKLQRKGSDLTSVAEEDSDASEMSVKVKDKGKKKQKKESSANGSDMLEYWCFASTAIWSGAGSLCQVSQKENTFYAFSFAQELYMFTLPMMLLTIWNKLSSETSTDFDHLGWSCIFVPLTSVALDLFTTTVSTTV